MLGNKFSDKSFILFLPSFPYLALPIDKNAFNLKAVPNLDSHFDRVATKKKTCIESQEFERAVDLRDKEEELREKLEAEWGLDESDENYDKMCFLLSAMNCDFNLEWNILYEYISLFVFDIFGY